MVAAALWLAYLIPAVLRRREYMATERNAVRLQQTLRILAETAEVPREIRVEATARDAAAQERILKRYQERAAAKVRADAVGTESRVAATPPRARRTGRMLRRTRAMTSLVLLAATVAAGWGAVQLVFGGSWLILAAGGVGMIGCVAVLGRLARAGLRNAPARASEPEAAPTVPELHDHLDDRAEVEPPVVARPTWTPRPIPKPLYQSPGSIAASSMASLDAAIELRRAAARAELAARAARLAPQPTPLRPPAASAAVASGALAEAGTAPNAGRFALMGRVDNLGRADESGGAVMDLDAALRRRRAAS